MDPEFEVARTMLDAWNRREVESVRELATPDCEWRPANPGTFEGAVYRGWDDVVRGIAELWETWETFQFEEDRLEREGDEVVWLGHVRVRGRGSSVELRQEFGIHMTFDDRRLARAQSFLSWDSAVASARSRP